MIKKKFESFEKVFLTQWGEYMKLHAELDTYRGKEIGDNTKKINELLHSIQQVFLDMHPALVFVVRNYPHCLKVVDGYNRFIEDLKKAGAVEETQGVA